MESTKWLMPSDDMNLWKINDGKNKVTVKWSHIYFEDYKDLSYRFYECGYKIFEYVIDSGHNNIKSDMWFFPGIFLLRQSIELGLKALLCRNFDKNKDIQKSFEQCCHDVLLLFQCYLAITKENYLTVAEKEWLTKYLNSLESVDRKSDVFRFPFEENFFSQYKNKFLDNVAVAKNLLQAFLLIKKCVQKGVISEKEGFRNTFKPEFFIFASHGIGNCFLWQRLSDKEFYVKISGYNAAIDYIYNNQGISKETKFYPLMFMFRNTVELCLKRLFYCRVKDGVPLKIFYSKRKSHLIKKDLWRNVKPIILKYKHAPENNEEIINIVERLIEDISLLDKNGYIFRYPTSYSLEYQFDNKSVDLKNIYECFSALINYLDSFNCTIEAEIECQNEMKAEYEAESQSNTDWY